MKLRNVAKMFNNTRCVDSYTGAYLFDGQLDVYTEGVRDGITVQRRVLELAPGTQVPTRRAIRFGGENWLVGIDNFDIWKGEKIREKYALQKAEGLATVKSLAAYFSGSPGLQAYAGRIWVKTLKEISEDSEEYNQLNTYFASTENVEPHQVILLGGRSHIVKEVYPATAGHLAAVVEMIDEPFQGTLTVDSTDIDPITNEPKPGASYSALWLRWQSAFAYLSQMTPNFERGDEQFVVAAGSNIAPGAMTRYNGEKFTVIATRAANGVLYVHSRRRA